MAADAETSVVANTADEIWDPSSVLISAVAQGQSGDRPSMMFCNVPRANPVASMSAVMASLALYARCLAGVVHRMIEGALAGIDRVRHTFVISQHQGVD